MSIAKSITNNMLQLLTSIETELQSLTEKVSHMDKCEQDLLHEMEFTRFNACQGYELAKRVQEVRQERRIYKDELEKIQSLNSSVSINKSKLKDNLKKVLNYIDKHDSKQRIYTPRVLTDIKLADRNYQSNLHKLRKVNKSKLKFESDPHYDRITELLQQVSGGKQI